MKIFIFPHAGGVSFQFYFFKDIFSFPFEVSPLEYPGRMKRANIPFIDDAEELANYFYEELRKISEPYVFWGHSMGALIAFLVAQKFQKNNDLNGPAHLFVSGRAAPSTVTEYRQPIYQLPHKEFWDSVRELEGTPDQLLESEGFQSFWEPIIRNDFKLVESYEYQKRAKLSIPITVISGSEDNARESTQGWALETDAVLMQSYEVQGNHFFIFETPEEVVEIIQKQLAICI